MLNLKSFQLSLTAVLLHIVCYMMATATSTSMEDFFPEIFACGNLSAIRWDHAVNSKALLSDSLQNDKEMIEADVLLGFLSAEEQRLHPNNLHVIMGHPPLIISDLTLADFLTTVLAHNANPNTTNKKGVKLDFKMSSAYARAMSSEILLTPSGDALKPEYTTLPVWLNGDIARGPANDFNDGVDMKLDDFRGKPSIANGVVWSLGWTTGDYKEGVVYTKQQVDAMKDGVVGLGNVTFPVRAMYAAKSGDAMRALLEMGTLTVWSAQQDDQYVDVPALAGLIRENLQRVYVDVPDVLWQRIVDAMAR